MIPLGLQVGVGHPGQGDLYQLAFMLGAWTNVRFLVGAVVGWSFSGGSGGGHLEAPFRPFRLKPEEITANIFQIELDLIRDVRHGHRHENLLVSRSTTSASS